MRTCSSSYINPEVEFYQNFKSYKYLNNLQHLWILLLTFEADKAQSLKFSHLLGFSIGLWFYLNYNTMINA